MAKTKQDFQICCGAMKENIEKSDKILKEPPSGLGRIMQSFGRISVTGFQALDSF